jgi:hypothetical protein
MFKLQKGIWLILTKPNRFTLADKELLPSQHIVDAGYVDGALLVKSK